MSSSWLKQTLLLVWYPAKWMDNLMTSLSIFETWLECQQEICLQMLHFSICLMSGEWTKIAGWKMDHEWRCFYAWKRDDFQPEKCKCTREYIWIRPYWNLSRSIALSCLSELNICKLCMWKMPSEQCSKPCSMKSQSGILKYYLVILLK